MNSHNTFPLSGITVVEFGGLAPGPFTGMVLADWGANVIRIDKPLDDPSSNRIPRDVLARGKRSIAIDPRVPSGLAVVKELVCKADVVIDPFRPGVMERLGLGPDVFLGDGGLNERLVYARLVGFSRDGPHKDMAGHDVNYLALSGILSMLPGHTDRPSFPLNLIADFGGGGLMCAMGVLLALFERERSGKGQVVDNDMVTGARYLSSFVLINSFIASASPGMLPGPSVSNKDLVAPFSRMQNTLDDGAPCYAVYTCADGKWFSVGCLEPKFYAMFLETFLEALPSSSKLGWTPTLEHQYRREEWPKTREFFERGFGIFHRDHWATIFAGKDACAVPVLTPHEASLLASTTASPAPHPYLSRTPARTPTVIAPDAPAETYWLQPGQHTDEILTELGLRDKERQQLVQDGAVRSIKQGPKL